MSDKLLDKISDAIYQGVLESCDGYVEGQEAGISVDPTDPDDAVVVDGRITFADVADKVIDVLIDMAGRGELLKAIDGIHR